MHCTALHCTTMLRLHCHGLLCIALPQQALLGRTHVPA